MKAGLLTQAHRLLLTSKYIVDGVARCSVVRRQWDLVKVGTLRHELKCTCTKIIEPISFILLH